MTHIVNTAAGLIFVAVFFGVIYLADQDMQAAAKLDSIDAQLLASESRIQRAARALCAAEAGHGAEAVWTPAGELICKGVKQ